jgi:hypothetical protein
VDPELLDVDELRRAWLSDRPNALTAALLQAAWLASNEVAHRGSPAAEAPEVVADRADA